jgi:hypothetical protein
MKSILILGAWAFMIVFCVNPHDNIAVEKPRETGTSVRR